jgi:hypothetical protein
MVEVPFSEVVVIARHLKTARLDTFLSETALKDVRDAATPPPTADRRSGLSAQRFVVEAVVRRGGTSDAARDNAPAATSMASPRRWSARPSSAC